jgi:multicomponent Na+:H+ antiporter subunit E
MSWAGRVVALTVLWVLLWGDLSVANILSGLAIAVGVVVLFPTGDRHRRAIARPVPTLRLFGVIAREMVVSNAALTRDVLSRRPRIAAGVVDCPLSCTSAWVGALVANIIALSPGTMAVDVDVDEQILRIHVLRLTDPDDTRRYVAGLEALVVHAFGTPREVASLTAIEAAR